MPKFKPKMQIKIFLFLFLIIINPFEGNTKYVQDCLVKYNTEYFGWSGFFNKKVTFYSGHELDVLGWFKISKISKNINNTYAVIDWSEYENIILLCNRNMCSDENCDFDDFHGFFAFNSTEAKDEKGNQFFICIDNDNNFCK